MAAGTYEADVHATWRAFREEYDRSILELMDEGNRQLTLLAFKHFERIARPRRMAGIDARMIDRYKTQRA